MTDTSDSADQVDLSVIAASPAISMGQLYQSMAASLALATQNAVAAQQQMNLIHEATTVLGINLLYSNAPGVNGQKPPTAEIKQLLQEILTTLQNQSSQSKPSSPDNPGKTP